MLQEAFMDAPLRVEEMGFNISAPHIHAAALEALDLKPGDRCGQLVVAEAWPCSSLHSLHTEHAGII
jgi:hypothetical protein